MDVPTAILIGAGLIGGSYFAAAVLYARALRQIEGSRQAMARQQHTDLINEARRREQRPAAA